VIEAVTITLLSLACFAAGTCGWIFHKASPAERGLVIAAGGLLMYGSLLSLGTGAVLGAAVVGWHGLHKPR
jgi:TRAP-type uncharacterized transport system fused permease subunit